MKHLKVMSYNIHHGKGVDGQQDLERIALVIENSNIDLAGIQEVDVHNSERSNWVDQAEWLSQRLNMHYAFGANKDFDPDNPAGKRKQYGTLILSRFPIQKSTNHVLPQVIDPTVWNETRGVLEVDIEVDGQRIRVLNTHLGLSQKERFEQIEYLLGLSGNQNSPCIITGDFNATPDSEEIIQVSNSYRDVFYRPPLPNPKTFLMPYPVTVDGFGSNPEVGPSVCIDYIFCSSHFTVLQTEVIHSQASDHLPITALLSFA